MEQGRAPEASTPGATLMARLDALARHSDTRDGLERLFLSPAHRACLGTLEHWCRAIGLTTSVDALGTLTARLEGATPDAPALILGSHVDTVRDAGRYDGALGVLAALGAIEGVVREGRRLPFALELVAFGDEEGVRFPSTLSSSRALAGRFDPATLDLADEAGVTMREALVDFGGRPDDWASCRRDPSRVIGFVEAHIEQGPALEHAGAPLGVVTAIAGATRLSVTVEGRAGHAGTVPMALRADALAAAAEMILAVERLARSREDLVATVGRIEALPGAVNVIPGLARFTVDLRSASDEIRREALAALEHGLAGIAAERGVAIRVATAHDAPAVACDPALQDALAAAIAAITGAPAPRLASGAGHDAMALAPLCPVAMLFVRCRGGVSHHPDESITAADAEALMACLSHAIAIIAARHAGGPA